MLAIATIRGKTLQLSPSWLALVPVAGARYVAEVVIGARWHRPFSCAELSAHVLVFVVLLLLAVSSPEVALAQAAPGDAASTEAEGEVSSPAQNPYAASEEGSKPGLIPPRLTHFEDPVYPEKAKSSGLAAVVELKITVGLDGTVSDPEVIEPQGHGFDEAATTAALKLRFSPALLGGKAQKVRIGFRFIFEQEVVETTVVEEVTGPGEIEGTLLIAGDDTPLPGVEIRLTDGLGSVYSATSDKDGRWILSDMTPGAYRVDVEAIGFAPLQLQEVVVPGEVTEVTYRILPQSTETELYVYGERPPREMTRRTLERRQVERIPGTSGDALRSIQSLPGVARPPGLAGLLIVRGSAPQDTGVFVDGSQIPLAYHFGGLSSVIPTELIEKLDFYPGNFSVRYGRFNAGIVDIAMRKPNTDCYGDYGVPTDKTGCYHGLVQMDLIDGRVLAQGPVPGTENWSFALAGRRSWIDTWVRPVLETAGSNVTQAPVYYDYQAIVERNLGPNDKLSFRLFGSDDELEVILANPAAQDPGFGGSLTYGTAFVRGQILYQKALTSTTNIDTMFSIGHERVDFSLGGNIQFAYEGIPIDLRSEIGHQFHRTTKLNVGFDFQTAIFDVFVRAPPPPREGEVAPGPLATQIPLETDSNGTGFRPAWYADVEWQPTERWRVVPGLRFDYARDTEHVDTSPRVTARYALVLPDDGFWGGRPLGTVLKAGIGRFAQPPAYDQTDDVFGTPGIESNKSMHYSLGVEQDLTEQIDVSVEGYFKDLSNSVSSGSGQPGSPTYVNEGSGRVLGMETLLTYKPDDRFFGWISYTLSQSVRRDCPGCELREFQYDQTHNLIMLGSYRLGAGWEIGARFRVVSGPLVTPVANEDTIPSVFSSDAGTYVPLQGKPYSERLPLFHQLDLRVDKSWQLRTWKLSTYVDVQNVYNHAADEAYVYNYNYSQKAYQTGLPIIPSLGVRGEF